MTSHTYQFKASSLARCAGGPLLALSGFALLIHFLTWAHLLPEPRAALDTDRVVLLHQAQGARTGGPVEIVLVGDSSCLMDVDAPRLSAALGVRVRNLGTSSYVDLESMGRMLAAGSRLDADLPRLAVLLMHPQSLRVRDATNQHVRALRAALAGRDDFDLRTWRGRWERWSGIEQWRGRVLARGVPFPLPGAYGRRYGFTHDLWRYLDLHAGSAVDPHHYAPEAASGNAEYRLAPALESESRRFRVLVPRPTRLAVGITPSPLSFAGHAHAAQGAEALSSWSRWLDPALALTNLPILLPDDQFASVTHLNATARVTYTDLLAECLRAQAPFAGAGQDTTTRPSE